MRRLPRSPSGNVNTRARYWHTMQAQSDEWIRMLMMAHKKPPRAVFRDRIRWLKEKAPRA